MSEHETKTGPHDNRSFGWWATCSCGWQVFDQESHSAATRAAVSHTVVIGKPRERQHVVDFQSDRSVWRCSCGWESRADLCSDEVHVHLVASEQAERTRSEVMSDENWVSYRREQCVGAHHIARRALGR